MGIPIEITFIYIYFFPTRIVICELSLTGKTKITKRKNNHMKNLEL